MNTNYYGKLFSIDLRHTYFTDSQCRDLIVAPTAACRELLRRQRLQFKQTSNGGVVICERRNTGPVTEPALEPIVPLAEDTVFTFQLLLRTPAFLNITDVDQSQINPFSVFIFANAPGAFETTDGTVRTVTIHDGPVREPIRTVSPVINYRVDHSLNPVSVAVHDDVGQRLYQKNVVPHLPTVTLDMTGYPEGVYRLRNMDSADTMVGEEKRFFISDSYATPRLFGFLQLRYTTEILAHPEAQHRFTLAFPARSINWVYKVNVKEIEPDHLNNRDPSNVHLHSPSRSPNGFPTVFSRTVVADAPRSVIFLSDAQIPLRETPYTGLQLQYVTETPGSDGSPPQTEVEVLVPHMPNPRIDRLVKDGSMQLKSEMFLAVT